MDEIEAMQFALEKGLDAVAAIFVEVEGLVILRAEIVAFSPGYDEHGEHSWFLYTRSRKIMISESQYDVLAEYFRRNTTSL
jgi:hypothetical protein